jgi:hypothetical protein
MDKKFIKTTDVETAGKLTTLGFKLLSHIGSVYTFLNEVPQTLSFDSVDQSKIAYDNKLSL